MHRVLLACAVAASLLAADPVLWSPGGPAVVEPTSGHDLILALPGAGGATRDLYLSAPWSGTAPATTAFAVRAWLQQTDLQPSQISKQQRTVTEVMRCDRDAAGWHVHLRTVIQSPAQARQPAVVERIVVEADLAPTSGPPSGLTRVWSQPPWRRTDLPLPGELFSGPATITHSTVVTGKTGEQPPVEATRTVTAWLSQEAKAVAGGGWSRSGDGRIRVDDATGRIEAMLHNRPSDAGEGPLARRLLAAPVPGRFAAITVTYACATAPTAPTRLQLAVRSDGQWRQSSVPLAAGSRTVRIDASNLLGDGEVITDPDGVGIGLTSGYGAGAVSLTIERIGLEAAPVFRLGRTVVHVDPTRVRVRNGVDRIGPGLFGVHAVGALKAATAAALADAGIGGVRTIEHTGFAPLTGPPGRDGARAVIAAVGSDPADSVDCWAHGLLSFPPWGNDRAGFTSRMQAFAASLKTYGPAAGVQRWEVFNEPFMWARHINLPGGKLEDPSQHGYLPADLSAEVYGQLFRAAAEGARGSGIRLGGPSSAEVAADDWRHLEQFVLPVIRSGGADVSFLAEHHYQGDPRQFAAEYAVVQAAVSPFRMQWLCPMHDTAPATAAGPCTACGMARVSAATPIEIWNTECNDLADRPGTLDTPEKLGLAKTLAQRRAFYHIAEICDHIGDGFDHTRGRSIHALWNGKLDVADGTALRLMRQLRGQPMPVTVPDATPGHRSRLVAAASRNGSTGVLILASRTGDQIVLPELMQHISAITILRADDQDLLRLDSLPAPGGPGWSLTLAPYEAAAITLTDLPSANPQHEIVRWAADAQGRGALWRCSAGSRLDLTVRDLPTRGRSRLILVAEDLDPGEAMVTGLGNTAGNPLPAATGGLRILRGDLGDVDLTQTDRQFTIATAPSSDGWRLCAIGIEIIDPK